MSLNKGLNEFGGGVSLYGGDNGGYAEIKSPFLLNASTAAAAGSVIGDATDITTGLTIVTGADGTKAVALPAVSHIGELVIVLNADESSALEIFPDAAGTSINDSSAGAAHTVAAMGLFIAVATSTTQWYAGEVAVSGA